jgi:hypothetical protein
VGLRCSGSGRDRWLGSVGLVEEHVPLHPAPHASRHCQRLRDRLPAQRRATGDPRVHRAVPVEGRRISRCASVSDERAGRDSGDWTRPPRRCRRCGPPTGVAVGNPAAARPSRMGLRGLAGHPDGSGYPVCEPLLPRGGEVVPGQFHRRLCVRTRRVVKGLGLHRRSGVDRPRRAWGQRAAALSDGQPAGHRFCDARAILDGLDPHRIYASPLLDRLFNCSRADE